MANDGQQRKRLTSA